MGCHSLLQDLPDAGIEPRSPALQVDCLPFEPPGKLQIRSDQISRLLPVISYPGSSFPLSLCRSLPPAFPAPPLLPLRIALCSLSGCFLQRCLYVLSHRSHVWWWGAGFICSSFWGRLPCLVVPIPDARSSLGHPPASPPGQGSLGRLSLFHHRSLSVLQAASTGYPGDTEGHVKLGSASLQVYSDPALRPPSTPEQGREDSSRLI